MFYYAVDLAPAEHPAPKRILGNGCTEPTVKARSHWRLVTCDNRHLHCGRLVSRYRRVASQKLGSRCWLDAPSDSSGLRYTASRCRLDAPSDSSSLRLTAFPFSCLIPTQASSLLWMLREQGAAYRTFPQFLARGLQQQLQFRMLLPDDVICLHMWLGLLEPQNVRIFKTNYSYFDIFLYPSVDW